MIREFCDCCEKEFYIQEVKYKVSISRSGATTNDDWSTNSVFCSKKCMYKFLDTKMKGQPGLMKWEK